MSTLAFDRIFAYALAVCAASCVSRPTLDTGGRVRGSEGIALVSISGGAMQSGFALGELRRPTNVGSFRIMKFPVTRAQYDDCIRQGACAPTDRAECPDIAYKSPEGYAVPNYTGGPAESPAICVGQPQAASFCRWIGGTLPTLDQWTLAARGSSPSRYSWGDAPTACDQHPLSPQVLGRLRQRALLQAVPPESRPPECPPTAFDGSEISVGKHPSGAASSGIEDVLLTPGELLAADEGSPFNACGGAAGHCVVFGLEPGAIDSVEAFLTGPDNGPTGSGSPIISHAYAFRCAIPTAQ